jgi:hypothetical protein
VTRPSRGAAVLALLFAGCGYLRSGSWSDDPDNWGRVFGSSKPPGVEVLHSFYWRSPHFTYEAGYFFAMRDTAGLRNELFSRNRLLRLPPEPAARARGECFGSIPEWFVPKSADRYEVWVYQDEPRGNFRLFVDREDGTLFLSDHQV